MAAIGAPCRGSTAPVRRRRPEALFILKMGLPIRKANPAGEARSALTRAVPMTCACQPKSNACTQAYEGRLSGLITLYGSHRWDAKAPAAERYACSRHIGAQSCHSRKIPMVLALNP